MSHALDPAALATDREAARKLVPFGGEIEAGLAVYAELLLKWQRTINLVSATTLPHIWTRHFADSLQVSQAMPEARIWVDLGSGAGFPGLVTAIALKGLPGALVHLIDSDQRKCAFLREVSRETGAPTIVHNARIEDVAPEIGDPIDAVSARALAPLPQLLDYAAIFLRKGARGVFLKGQHLDDELTDSAVQSRYEITVWPSKIVSSAHLLIVKNKIAEPR